jgi:hypothetical protein
MDARAFILFALTCVCFGGGLATGWFPVHAVLPTLIKLKLKLNSMA